MTMRVVRAMAVAVAALCLSGVGPTATAGGMVAPAAAAARSDVKIWIHPVAEILEQPGEYHGSSYNGTTITIKLHVRCPRGDRGWVIFAGLPGYFPDGRFAEPYLPGNTMPGLITCTGHRQPLTTQARTISRLQDPETQPFTYFTPSRATAVISLFLNEQTTHLESGRIRIVDRRGNG